jgi:hypothetical protein
MTTDTITVDAKALASVRGALAELGGDLDRLNETAFADGVTAMDNISQRVAPIMLEARKVWVNMATDRDASKFTAAKFIEAAAVTDDGYKAYAAGTKARDAMVNLFNFATLHTAKTESTYRAYRMAGFDLSDYCEWLPKASKYGTNGKLLTSHAKAEADAKARRDAEAEVSAATPMFATKVETFISDATTPTERLVELDALIHDAKALRDAIAANATPAEKTAAGKAFKARVTDRTAKKVAKLLAK